MSRRVRLSTRLGELLNSLLGERKSWIGGTDSGTSVDGSSVQWFLASQRVGKCITYLEAVTSADQSFRDVWCWNVAPDEDGTWMLESVEKNHVPLDEEWVNEELEESIGRLENPLRAQTALESPTTRAAATPVLPPTLGAWPRKFRSVTGLAVFICAFFALLGVSSLQFYRMNSLVGGLNSLLNSSSTHQIERFQDLSGKIQMMNDEVAHLQDDVEREKMAFDFSRKNTAMNLRRQAEELPPKDHSRRRAYEYLADRIESAVNYGDILHQISRLPLNNGQAETLMAVDSANIVPLSANKSAVPGFSFPVRLDGKKADGEDFMVSSGFGVMRPTNLGTGGYFPHLAVDIINIGNILRVTSENSVVRFPGEPGSVVASADGAIVNIGFNNVYGHYLEIDHPLQPQWREQYEAAERLTTFYAHFAEKPHWSVGDRVAQEEKLGMIGDSGLTTGPHLHYELRVYRAKGEFRGVLGSFDRINPFTLRDAG